jgi:FkbM family methyltransferase
MSGVFLPGIKNLGKLAQILRYFPNKISEEDLLNYIFYSKSEIDQELIAFLLLGREGFFVEFGACDGILGSNTYFLEKTQGWTGILAEPIPSFFRQIEKHRKARAYPYAIFPTKKASIQFIETRQKGLSTISGYENSDRHSQLRTSGTVYRVKTITLFELLKRAKAPRVIDFLSIDTEGGEFEILAKFPFEEFNFKFISVEHNHSNNRNKLRTLLNDKGYTEILSEFSGGDWWFINRRLFHDSEIPISFPR